MILSFLMYIYINTYIYIIYMSLNSGDPIILSHTHIFFNGHEAWWCSRGCHCSKVANAWGMTRFFRCLDPGDGNDPGQMRMAQSTEATPRSPGKVYQLSGGVAFYVVYTLVEIKIFGQLSHWHSVTTEIVLDASHSQNHPESLSWVQVMFRYVNN